MSDMLYIQTDKNMKVLSEQVQLQEYRPTHQQ